jgi:methionyl-tRNA formyltransferase
VLVENEDTSDTLFKKMEIVASSLLLEMLPDYIDGKIQGIEQDESLVTFAPSIKREEEIINWEDTKRNIYNKIRAFNSVPGAYSILDGASIKIWASEEVNKEYDGEFGEIVEVLKDRFIVKVKDGGIAVKELQVAGKKKMFARDFLNGNLIPIGALVMFWLTYGAYRIFPILDGWVSYTLFVVFILLDIFCVIILLTALPPPPPTPITEILGFS